MIVEAIRLAGGRLRANLLRSMLTVVGLVAVGNGSAADMSDQFSRLGANTLTVQGGRGFGRGVAGTAGSNKTLTLTDVAALEKLDSVAAVAPVVQATDTITNGSTNVQATVKGTTTAIRSTDNLRLAAGSFFLDFAEERGILDQSAATVPEPYQLAAALRAPARQLARPGNCLLLVSAAPDVLRALGRTVSRRPPWRPREHSHLAAGNRPRVPYQFLELGSTGS